MSDFVVIHQNVTFGRLHLEWTFRVLIHGFLWSTKNIIFLFLKLFSKNNMLMHLHLSNFGKIQSLKFLTAFAYPHVFKRLLNLVSSWTDFTWFYTKRIVVSNFHREYRLNVGIFSLVQRLGYVYLQRYAQEILVT